VITLTLLHPTQSIPVQSWNFESESVIRIGRANDNDVIIYSAVVSRHHAELWNNPSGWEIINFGVNGTYINDESIIQAPVVEGMTIRLGNSGPKIRLQLGVIDPELRKKTLAAKRLPLSHKDESLTEKETLLTRRPTISTDIIIQNDAVTQADFD